MKSVLNHRLITIVLTGWISLLVSGLVLVLATPSITVIIDRSYCPSDQWQTQVVIPYRDLYQKHQDKQLKIESITLLSDLGQESSKKIPTPEEIAILNTYGKLSSDRQKSLEKLSQKAKLLRCL
ncbi:hypothetical protein CEP10_02470 [Cylindrospermopsis raciborskii S07]|uniref:Uncharacterized protein n=3 Tax=Cylindrospermopsis raciborskii TaxID=77022 RepID=A0A853MCU2_9CYAN|nr:hypothetical protein [Cylindrospermopsis raciborskii]EFA69005.1 hypothetical protein CRC_02366 [Cylindrospermopsis raciborskii CS-505]MBA4445964.1 hypothetical protein [Cylindrospermopsis raciborskii CS-506_C]MBA4450203.1 hypothetical protein [Cylindrospermopsis raciborskii CS-506_D]MBA4456822.1 hypothetical protein [Cylindrospermopsis raciborskii CS-506_B]MBA4466179.1 hypothetical protein [Cylindrospermopsis raciborskii CS-506_A]